MSNGPQPLSHDDMKNSSERHTSHEAGLMNADDVVVTYAKLSTKRKDEPSGPSHAVEKLLKESKAFQRTLQDGKTFETKEDLLEKVESFLEDQRDSLGALLKKLNSANQVDAATGSVAAKKPCLPDARAFAAEEPVDAGGMISEMDVVGIGQQAQHPPNNEREIIRERLRVLEYAQEHGNQAAVDLGYHPTSLKKWRKKETVYKQQIAIWQRKDRNGNAPYARKELSQNERHMAYRTILKRLKEDTDNVGPFLNPVPHEVEFYYDAVDLICLADVEQKVQENKYHNERLFIADVKQMFSNCYYFNASDSPYYAMGYNLNKTFLELCQQHFPGSTLLPQLPEQKPNVAQQLEQKPIVMNH